MKYLALIFLLALPVSCLFANTSHSSSLKYKADSSVYDRAAALRKDKRYAESNKLFLLVINNIGTPKTQKDSIILQSVYWDVANNYMNLWDAANAVIAYDNVLTLDDHKFGLNESYNDFLTMDAHHEKAILYSFLGDFQKAASEGLLSISYIDTKVKKLDSALAKTKKNSLYYNVYSSVKDLAVTYYDDYYLDTFRDLVVTGDFANAKKILQKAKKIDKEVEEDEKIYKVGTNQLADGDYAGVIKQWRYGAPSITKLSLDYARKDIIINIILAQAYEKTGDNKKAFSSYKAVLEASPANKYARERITELKKIPGMDKKEELVPASNILPPPPLVVQPVVVETGKLKTRKDSLSMAEKLYDKGAKLKDKKQVSAAIAYFSKSIEISPRPLTAVDTASLDNAYYMRSSLYLSAGQIEKGLNDINESLKLRPSEYISHGDKGLVLSWRGDYPAAANEFELALKYYYAKLNRIKGKLAVEKDKKERDYYSALLNVIKHSEPKYRLSILTGLILEGKTQEANELVKGLKADFPDDYHVNSNDILKIYTEHVLARDYAGGITAVLNSTNFKFHRATDNSLNLNNDYLTSLVFLGQLNEKADSTALALDLYQKVLIMSPGHKFAAERIAALTNKQIESNKTDKAPPTIVLYAPAATDRGQTVKTDKNKTMLVKGRAEDPSGISWVKINGKNLDAAKVSNGFFEVEIPPVTLLEIQAADNAGNESHTYTYTVTVNETPPQMAPVSNNENYYALFVACSNYEGKWPPLNSTVDEARRFGGLLSASYNFKTDTLFNAGRMSITQRISSFISEHNKPTDNLVIFFAGHGTMEKVDNEPVGYLVPLDAQRTEDYIARKDIAVLLNRSSAKHILFITDACLSEFMRGDVDAQAMEAQNSTDYNLPSRQLLTSSGTKRAAGKSILVPSIISFLQKNDKPYLSVTDLYGNVLKEMVGMRDSNPELALPTIGPMRIEGDKLGAFYFKKN